MHLKVLGCYAGELHGRHASGFLLNGKVLMEAGSVTSVLALPALAAIRNIMISHAHLDHTKELIFLVDNLFLNDTRGVRLSGIPPVLDQLRRHLFNDQLWPDFTRIPEGGDPVLQFEELREGDANEIDGLRVVPIAVTHTVPASGFLISDGTATILYTGDTGPTREIWERGRATPDLTAVLAECSFPDERRDLALESGHLTPSLLATELAKLGRPEVPVFVTHLKPAYAEVIVQELARVGPNPVQPLQQGRDYTF